MIPVSGAPDPFEDPGLLSGQWGALRAQLSVGSL